MHPKRKQKLLVILGISFGVILAVSLALSALKQNINLYFTPAQIASGDAPKNHEFRLGGLVKNDSVWKIPGTMTTNFVVTDFKKSIKVTYTGVLPDLFREGQGIVADGQLNSKGVFVATQVLAKHDEKYTPPES